MKLLKRLTGIISAVCVAAFAAGQTAFSAEKGYAGEIQECFGYFSEEDDFWSGLGDSNADWAAYCRARLDGTGGSEQYADRLEKRLEQLSDTVRGGGFVKPTELQRTGIFLAALGKDPAQAVRLGVSDNDQLGRQGFNAYIWALITLNVTGVQPEKTAVNTAETLTEYIISQQHVDGSFSLFGDGGDVDITAAAVYALSGTDAAGAREAAQRGADWLCGIEGGYTTMGVRNCESTAQAVIALCAAGRVEKAQEAAAQLEEYRRDGGYAHLPDGGVNGMATAQALEAFTAMELSERGEGLFSRLAEDMPTVAPESVEARPGGSTEQTGNAGAVPEAPRASGLTGVQIKAAASIAAGVLALVLLVVCLARRKKALIAGAVLLAAVSGGVWLLDVKSPEEYYAQQTDGGMQVTFSADCSAALDRMDSIDQSVNPAEVVPADGVVIAECTLGLPEGSSAFDALISAARAQQVRVDYTGGSWGTYVRSIGYIGEFGFGELSGWMYRVNGEFPQVSAGDFTLSDGDVVEFVYTCDLGRDVGDHFTSEING